jgi:hypothetical protein
MANYIVENCVNPSDTLVASSVKGGIIPGSVVRLDSENAVGCYTVIEETIEPTGINITGVWDSCLQCFNNNQFVFEIRYCNSDTSVFRLPIDYGFQINVFYGVITQEGTQCFEFLGVTQNQTSNTETPTPTNEFDGCNRCLFEGAVAVRNNNANYQQLYENTRQNYTNIINRAAVS